MKIHLMLVIRLYVAYTDIIRKIYETSKDFMRCPRIYRNVFKMKTFQYCLLTSSLPGLVVAVFKIYIRATFESLLFDKSSCAVDCLL